jgi:hypothetical protein
MTITPVGDMFALNADRYQIHVASPYGPFVLGKGLQSQEFSFDIPNEAVYEIGNEEQRGVSIRATQFKGTLASLLVDTDLIQLYTSKMGDKTNPADSVGTTISGGTNTIVKIVSPVNFPSGTSKITYTIEAKAEDKICISGHYNISYDANTIIKDIPGVEVVALHSGLLVTGDKATFDITKEQDWESADFKSAKLDFLVVGRDNSSSDTVFKTDYAEGMIANSFNIDTNANGNAQESFDTEGNSYYSQEGYVYRNATYANAADVAAGNIVLDSRVLVGSEVPHMNGNSTGLSGKFFFKVTRTKVDGTQGEMAEKATSAVDLDFVYTDASHTFMPFATSMALGDRYEFTFWSSVAKPTDYSVDFTHTGTPDNVDGRYVPVYYGDSKLQTVSSASIKTSLNRERKQRQGFVNDYFTPAKVPVVTGDVASMDGDLSLVKLLTKGSTATTDLQFDYNEHGTYTNTNDIALQIKIINPADNTSEIVRFTVSKIQISNSSIPIAVGSDTARSFSWTAKNGSVTIHRD